MISYKLIFHKDAEKFIKKYKREGLLFYQAFHEISQDKNNFSKYDIRILVNRPECFRLRIGKYRAIFRVVEAKIIIYVLDIGSRGSIYK